MTTIAKLLLTLLGLLTFDFVAAEESGLRELTSKELKNDECDVEEIPATVKELSLGQRRFETERLKNFPKPNLLKICSENL